MIKSSKHSINIITNQNKLSKLNSLFVNYKLCLEFYINLILNQKLPLKKQLSSKDLPDFNISHSRYKQLIYKQASEIIRSQTKKCSDKRFNNYKKIYKYYLINKPESKFSLIKFKDLNLNDIIKTKYFSKPNLSNISINLDERFFDIKQGNHFDSFVKIILPEFNEKGTRALQIKLPLKQHKHSNNLMSNGFNLRKNIQLKKIKGHYFINLIWEKEDVKKKTKGKSLGIDIGYKKLIATSEGNLIGSKMEDIYELISRKQQRSKNFKQSLVYRDNMINYYVNQMNLDNINHIIIEDLKNVKSKSKGKINKKFNNKLQRWSYRKLISKLELTCMEKGIELLKVSPAYTSQMCSSCGKIDKESRKGENYLCISCGFKCDADINASINIHNRGIYSFSNEENKLKMNLYP